MTRNSIIRIGIFAFFLQFAAQSFCEEKDLNASPEDPVVAFTENNVLVVKKYSSAATDAENKFIHSICSGGNPA